MMTPSWAFLVGLGRLGCFASGCCFGKPTESGIGLVFSLNSHAGSVFPGAHLIPTQLFEAAEGFLLVAFTLLVDRKKRFYGFTFCSMLFLYGLGRFLIDFYRFYESEMIWFHLGRYAVPATQIFAMLLVLTGVLVGLYLKAKSRETSLQTKVKGSAQR